MILDNFRLFYVFLFEIVLNNLQVFKTILMNILTCFGRLFRKLTLDGLEETWMDDVGWFKAMLSWYDGFGWGHKLTIRDEDPDLVLDGVVCFSTHWALPFCVKQPATGFTTIFTGGSLRDYFLFMSD